MSNGGVLRPFIHILESVSLEDSQNKDSRSGFRWYNELGMYGAQDTLVPQFDLLEMR